MSNPNEPMPDFSDVKSGSSSEAMSKEEARRPQAEVASYTVKAGDSLSKIAKQHYGDASKWRAIYDANRDLIKNPDLIHPGWVLTLPQL
ncbi:MAG: LysM peptidoglycan-binding domain-containing protein [Gemmatimonadaceae bacterium]